jgi:hypothetical protein
MDEAKLPILATKSVAYDTGEILDAITGLVEKSLIATRIDETQAHSIVR